MTQELAENTVISVVGLGYVGLPVAVAFGHKYQTIGFDINSQRIKELNDHKDHTLEVTTEELKASNVKYTDSPQDLKVANFHIVAVPTPIDQAKQPNMGIVLAAARTIGGILKTGDIVVFESTVYPGATEDDCVPILEECSGLKCGPDFTVGYSPERINPADKDHTFTTTIKVVSGQDEKTLEKVAKVYESVITAGVHRASTIKVAEAAKVIENSQRDLNIAFMNELSIIFGKLDIDTKEVLKAAGTKWNFLNFTPGLVGGHCIGVDPFYLTHKAQSVGYNPEVILAGRRINDNMGKHVARQTVKRMVKSKIDVSKSRITILGLTFKENCPDLRNTRVSEIINSFKKLDVDIQICDPVADADEIQSEIGVAPTAIDDLKPADAVILAVAHKEIIDRGETFITNLVNRPGIFADVKGAFDPSPEFPPELIYWRL